MFSQWDVSVLMLDHGNLMTEDSGVYDLWVCSLREKMLFFYVEV